MDEGAGKSAPFPTTRWSAIRAARTGDGPERQRAWGALVTAYWKPAYKHVRIRWKSTAEDAEDAIQSFFERATEKDFFTAYDPERGRFRTFFRVCLDRHVANAAKAQKRLKRGGGAQVLSLDFEEAEAELARAGAAAWESPDACFDREWRRCIFGIAIETLRGECHASGKTVHFEIFEAYDLSASDARPTYEQLAHEHELPVSTVTNHLAWARRELRRIVLAKLRELTDGDDELRDEARVLLGSQAR